MQKTCGNVTRPADALLTGDAEDFMYKINEEMKLWPNLEYPIFESDVINTEKKVNGKAQTRSKFCFE